MNDQSPYILLLRQLPKPKFCINQNRSSKRQWVFFKGKNKDPHNSFWTKKTGEKYEHERKTEKKLQQYTTMKPWNNSLHLRIWAWTRTAQAWEMKVTPSQSSIHLRSPFCRIINTVFSKVSSATGKISVQYQFLGTKKYIFRWKLFQTN